MPHTWERRTSCVSVGKIHSRIGGGFVGFSVLTDEFIMTALRGTIIIYTESLNTHEKYGFFV